MNRSHASTSTIGGREDRSPQYAAYLFQRRVLLGCSCLMVFSLIIWCVAIATDHWIIISGGAGIFIPETKRFFMSSHSGLWRICRNTVMPTAVPNANVIRNFTNLAYGGPAIGQRLNLSSQDFVKEFQSEIVENPLVSFTEAAKRRMFAHWVRNEEHDFNLYRDHFRRLVLSTDEAKRQLVANDTQLLGYTVLPASNADDITKRQQLGAALITIEGNSTRMHLAMPELLQAALFANWTEKPQILRWLWHYARDLGVPAYILKDKRILLLVPPLPPKKGGQADGFNYEPQRRCKYIEMFSNSKTQRNDFTFDAELMDYIRTQASFACITVFVMSLGAIFSFYTFMQPRYMFKRLAGGTHLVAASTAFVVVQVLMAAVKYQESHLSFAYPEGAVLTYGYGVYLAWFTFAVNVLCGVMFIWYSGKKKGSKAPTDELAMADEPTIMGR